MRCNNKFTGTVIKRAALTGLLTTLLFTCEKMPEYCGDGWSLNSATQFCYGGVTYDKCSGAKYDPENQECDKNTGVLKERCPGGNDFFNAVTEFCENGRKHSKCSGQTYNTANQTCETATGTIKDRCGNGYFNPEAEFCEDGRAHGLCGGNPYNTEIQRCVAREVHTICNESKTVPVGIPCDGYTLTTTPAPASGGTIDPPGTQIYATGTLAAVTATAAPGYEFAGWSGDTTAASRTISVRMDRDKQLVAIFNPIATDPASYCLTVIEIPDNSGTVTRDPNQPCYAPGTQVIVRAAAAEHYRFTHYGGASGSSDPTDVIIMDGPKALIANFAPITYTLTVAGSPTSGGTTSNSQYNITAGTPVSISASPASGYTFNGWTISGSGTIANANDANTSVTVNGNMTVTANFELITYTLTVSRNTTAGGTVTPASQSGITAGTVVNISASAASGYTFNGWTISGSGTIANSSSASTSVTVNGDVTVTANFQQIPTYTLTMSRNLTEGGTTTPPSSQSGIVVGTPFSISASVNSGYTFVNWTLTSGTATFGNANSANTTVTLSSNATIRANFQIVIVSGSFTDSRDNRSYRTVQIGQQTWMAENLNYNASGSACYYNASDSCAKYGRLYNWATVMGGASSSTLSPSGVRGVCPVGWHVPSDAEWTALTNAVGGSSTAGTKLKSKSGWYNNRNGTDDYGFSALPGGGRWSGGDFDGAGYYGLWWSATELGASDAWGRDMYNNYDNVNRYSIRKTNLFSLRCVRDSAAPQ